MKTPEQLKYNHQDEWVRVEGTVATIGITDYAQDQLSDVVYADIKVTPGKSIEQGDLLAVFESVKASSDIIAPISGTVVEINHELNSSPEWINTDPYGRAWVIKLEMTDPGELNKLLDLNDYQAYRSK